MEFDEYFNKMKRLANESTEEEAGLRVPYPSPSSLLRGDRYNLENRWADGSFLEKVLTFLKTNSPSALRYAVIASLSELNASYDIAKHHNKLAHFSLGERVNDFSSFFTFSDFDSAFKHVEILSDSFTKLYSDDYSDRKQVLSSYIKFLSTDELGFDYIDSTYLDLDFTSYADLLDSDTGNNYAPVMDIDNQRNPHMVAPHFVSGLNEEKLSITDLEVLMMIELTIYHLTSNKSLIEYLLINLDFDNPIYVKDYLNNFATTAEITFLGYLAFLMFCGKSIEGFNHDLTAISTAVLGHSKLIEYTTPLRLSLVSLGKPFKGEFLDIINNGVLDSRSLKRLMITFQTSLTGTNQMPVINDSAVSIGNYNLITTALGKSIQDDMDGSNESRTYVIPLVALELMRFKQAFHKSPMIIEEWLLNLIKPKDGSLSEDQFDTEFMMEDKLEVASRLAEYLTAKNHSLSDLSLIVIATNLEKGNHLTTEGLHNLNTLSETLYDMGMF